MTIMFAIELKNVTKRFRKGKGLRKRGVVAVDRVTLSIREGELFGLLGPNDAGKTTLVRCISTLLIPDAGEIKIFAALYGLSPRERDKRIDFLMELLGLKEFEGERVERYSSGMRQKLSLARALLHDPKTLLLDEPTLGLDPQFSRFIRGFIKEELSQRRGKTILLTTHYMDEADELCDRIASP